MVHLGQVVNDSETKLEALPDLEGLQLGPEGVEHQDDATASVYGSTFAGNDLPKHEMPTNEMPREIAYRMIKDDLTLDGNPTLK